MRYVLMSLFTIIVWGTTFVSTRVLLDYGLSPAAIFFYRFLLSYVLIWLCLPGHRHQLWSLRVGDELLFFCMGLSGGSLYFLCENTALGITLTYNVALILCTTPLITSFLSHCFVRGERISRSLIYGSLVALLGVSLVIFNGSIILRINPLGDVLTLTAALLWGIYTIILKRFDDCYSVVFITRKVFFYGLLSILPFIEYGSLFGSGLLEPVICCNLLYLGIIASLLCFVMWNSALKHLGAIRTSNYLYFVPVVTLITSAIVLEEAITLLSMVGALLIIGGVYMSERGGHRGHYSHCGH